MTAPTAGLGQRAKRRTPPRVITDRRPVDHFTVNGRRVEPSVEVTVDGIRGRCVVLACIQHESGATWVDVITSRGFARTIHPNKIKTVHRSKTGVRP